MMDIRIRTKLRTIRGVIKYRKVLKRVIKTYLEFFEDFDITVWGSISEAEEEGIKFAVSQANKCDGPIVEVGTLFGHTACLIASLKRADIPLVAVDDFSWNPFYLPSGVHRRFTMRTMRYIMDHCSTQLFDGNAADFYSTHAKLNPSMVFIDAEHDYESVKRDIDWAISTGCPVISGHDYTDQYHGVVKAVNEAFGNNFLLFDSIWVHQN